METFSGKRIFITGGSGQVGFELQQALMPIGHILAPSRSELDLADATAVEIWLKHTKPDLIVNAAAYTAVDQAEKQRDQAYRLNCELPAQLAAYCASQSTPLVHFSTDYVYPGVGDTPWREDSATGPLNYYGETKRLGDLAIQRAAIQSYIFRVSWVYAARGHNFMRTMLNLAKTKESLQIVCDQVGAPTSASLIAWVVQQSLLKSIDPGVYHVAPRGHASWFDFAVFIFSQAKAHGYEMCLDVEKVSRLLTQEYPTPAVRPLNSRLDVSKIEKALCITLPNWQSSAKLTLQELLV